MQVILTEKEYNELKAKANQYTNISLNELLEMVIDKIENDRFYKIEIYNTSGLHFKSETRSYEDWTGNGLPFDGSEGKMVEKHYHYEVTIKRVEEEWPTKSLRN